MEILVLQSNEARVRFPAGAAYFAGHFPGQPIVPGVVLIAAAVQIARGPPAALAPLRLAHANSSRRSGRTGRRLKFRHRARIRSARNGSRFRQRSRDAPRSARNCSSLPADKEAPMGP
jgi:hypothetical protein